MKNNRSTARSRLLVAVLLSLVFVGMMGFELYGFIFTNDGINYFADAPHRLLYVALIALLGGVVAIVWSRLSLAWQRNVRLALLGAGAAFMIAAVTYSLIRLIGTASVITEFSTWIYIGVTLLCFCGFAGLLLAEFRLVWKRKKDMLQENELRH